MKLDGNTILITGGGTGIGLAFAKKFLELGNDVIITGRRQEKLDEAVAGNPGLHAIQGDVSDSAQVKALADRIRADFPKLNLLMNNAGIMRHRNLVVGADDLEELTQEFAINVNGPIRLISALIDVLKANKGTILNVSSGLAFVPLTSAPIYCATKAAIHSYTTSLRFQLEGTGVSLVELMPPAVHTEMTGDVPEDGAFAIITTDELVKATVAGLKADRAEIRPGQANQLHWMSRIAPGFINKQLFNGSKSLIPDA